MKKKKKKKKKKNQEKTQHMEEGGLRFTLLWSTREGTMHYHSFDELGLKKDCTDRDLVIYGFKRNLETIPRCTRFFRVGDAFFMVGGELELAMDPTRLGENPKRIWIPANCLWSAVPPTDGSFCESWTLCPATMKVRRDRPILVPLHDGRIFICGGTTEREGWAEFYDPEKGEFDAKNFPLSMGMCPHPEYSCFEKGEFDHDNFPVTMCMCPRPTSCFQWTDQVVMVYYDSLLCEGDGYDVYCKPSLLSYNIAENKWDKFEENFPPPLYDRGIGYRNLVYVGGDILFIIDYACLWLVYDLSSKKEVGEVCVKARPRGQRWPVEAAFYTGNKDIKSTSWGFYIFMPMAGIGDLEYAKVEVVKRKGGDYTATVQMKGVLKVGCFDDIYL